MSTTYTLIAQAYSCDAYGAGSYNECASETPTPSTGTDSNTSTNNSSSTANTGSSTSQTTTPEETSTDTTPTPKPNDTSETGTNTTQPPSTPETVTAKVDSMSWNVLIPIILGLAILFAFIMLLLKRRKNRDNQPPSDFQSPKF